MAGRFFTHWVNERGGNHCKGAWMGCAPRTSEENRGAEGLLLPQEKDQQVWADCWAEESQIHTCPVATIQIQATQAGCLQAPDKGLGMPPWARDSPLPAGLEAQQVGPQSWLRKPPPAPGRVSNFWHGALGCCYQPKLWKGKILVSTGMSRNNEEHKMYKSQPRLLSTWLPLIKSLKITVSTCQPTLCSL